MKNILVTGAAGFIGSYVCERLVNRGFNVVGLDDMSLGLARNIRGDVNFIQADASKLDDLQDSLSGLEIQGIIHLAGQSGGELSFSETLYDCKSNVLSTLSLLEFAKSRSIRKLVHASSVAVYGAGGNDGDFLDEEQKLNPTSPYGVSKSAAESYLRVLSEKNGVSATSLRFFNVYGPGQDLSRLDQGMLSIYLSQALSGSKISIKGSQKRYRDFVNVKDAAIACEKALGLSHNGHKAVNVCTGNKTTVSQALEILNEEFNNELSFEFLDSTPGDVEGWLGSTKKIKSVLGWSPEIEFNSGFRRMIKEVRHEFNRSQT